MRACVAREDNRRLTVGRLPIARSRVKDGAPSLIIEAFRPINGHVVAPRDESAGLRIQNIDKTIFRHAEDDALIHAVDGQSSQHEPDRWLVIPRIARHLSEVPLVRPC